MLLDRGMGALLGAVGPRVPYTDFQGAGTLDLESEMARPQTRTGGDYNARARGAAH